jgi:EAL domain-containing protein (putative c-di-GMP-specific phosphodiesterase class I)
VRWNHSEFGLIYPDEFIHLAEQTGLIVELTNWILRAACKQIRVWQEKGIDLNISINISPSSLLDPEFPDRLTGLLSSHKLNGKNITLEVTESSLVRDPELALGVLNQLAEQGILISIDDFGTGYSSLAYMKKMPASELKIDKSFVMDMLDSDSDLAIVKSTIDLAHNLHMSVVAEGVENREMLTQLKKLNCDYFQGYLFNRPANVTNFEKWLQEYSPSNYQ